MHQTARENRLESSTSIPRTKRQMQVLSILRRFRHTGLTPYEVALIMYRDKYVRDLTRNNAAPRLTELEQAGLVEIVGRQKGVTGKYESIYRLRSCDD